jgi:sarcosine oxidase subunit beta
MTEVADVVIVGAGVQGASLAFHLARRGSRVVVVERSVVGGGATGRSSGFVRMHYDLLLEARLAWASFPYFTNWNDLVGAGEPGFVQTGFLQLVPARHAAALRANVALQRAAGIDTQVVDRGTVARLLPGAALDDVDVAAHEPRSGYADPTGTAAGFLAAARAQGARLVVGAQVRSVDVAGDRVVGVTTDRGAFASPIVVDAAGAWAGELAAGVGLDVPIVPWRHDTAYFGIPDGRAQGLPVVIDHAREMYFRPEGHELLLVGLEVGSIIGGHPDDPMPGLGPTTVDEMADRVCARLPWMEAGTFRTGHDGQDGISPDQRPILGPAGPEGFFLDCGHSGTGFKTSPAIGAALAEWILDGRPTSIDVTPFGLDRFARNEPIVGEHPYDAIWR